MINITNLEIECVVLIYIFASDIKVFKHRFYQYWFISLTIRLLIALTFSNFFSLSFQITEDKHQANTANEKAIVVIIALKEVDSDLEIARFRSIVSKSHKVLHAADGNLITVTIVSLVNH